MFKKLQEWVRKNCKFAIDLTQAPANWEQDDSAMRRTRDLQNAPPAPRATAPVQQPSDGETDRFHASIAGLQVIQNKTKQTSEIADIELPGSGGQMSPRFDSVTIYYLQGDVIIEGDIYYPDSFIPAWGPIDHIFREFKEFYPAQLEEILDDYKQDNSTYKLIDMTKNGDSYHVRIHGSINASSGEE